MGLKIEDDGQNIGHQLLQVVTLNEHRHVVGVLDDVEQTAFIPRSFSHK